jgi:hypothetical protein
MPAVNLPKSLHQFERDFGYAGIYATSTGATKIAKDYRSQLQQLMRDGRYGEAMLKDLDDKINLIIYNRDHIPAAHQNLDAFKQALSDAVNYARQTNLINDADLGRANQLIFGGRMDHWRTRPEPPPGA